MVAALGLLITLLGFFVAFPRELGGNPRLFILVAGLHLLASIGFWQYSLSNPADTIMYYNDPFDYGDAKFRAGTMFVTQLVQVIKQSLGGSYFSFFILFQSFGLLGVALMLRSQIEIANDLRQSPSLWLTALLFLPGLHFWTSSISKDPLLFLAAALSIWAMIKIERRFPAFIIAVIIMLPVRPHIAAIAAISLMITLLLDSRTRLAFKIPFGIVAGIALAFILVTAQQSLKITSLDANALSDFVAAKQELGARSEQGAAITGLPLPLKTFSLLFRPFFFDASGLMGWIVSLENVVLLVIFGTLVRRFGTVVKLMKSVAYVRYCAIFACTLILLLSLVNYNVGLGLRQKYMAMPAILILYFTLITYRRNLSRQAEGNLQGLEPRVAQSVEQLR